MRKTLNNINKDKEKLVISHNTPKSRSHKMQSPRGVGSSKKKVNQNEETPRFE